MISKAFTAQVSKIIINCPIYQWFLRKCFHLQTWLHITCYNYTTTIKEWEKLNSGIIRESVVEWDFVQDCSFIGNIKIGYFSSVIYNLQVTKTIIFIPSN